MFILLDTDVQGLIPFYDYVNELDDKPVLLLDDLDDITDYKPNGSFHVVDTHDELDTISRWEQLVWATLGVRVFTDKLTADSPIYAGPVPSEDKVRRAIVDATNAETRAVHLGSFGVNYVGRTKLNPRNIFVLDNKKGNPLHDPSKDAVLEALYGSLPDDWWGSCGFVSSGNPDKLGAFLDEFQGDVIPLAFTTGGYSKLKYLGLDYVDTGIPRNTEAFGVKVRDQANRLSYDLSLPKDPEPEIESGFKYIL